MERLYIPAVMLLFVAIFMGISRAEVITSSQLNYFSSSYQVARETFIKAAQEVGASIESFQNPHMSPLGEPLFTDVAINPYGFAHLRRSNEDNIDLNRNFIDHTKPYPENEGYEELADVILPKSLSARANIELQISLLLYRLKHGQAAMKRAVSSDQFSHPQGLFLGGHHEAWSNRTLKEIASRYLSNAKRVVFIDVHTGLGPFVGAD